MMQIPSDRQLNTLLSRLLAKLESSRDSSVSISSSFFPGWSAEAIAHLQKAGLLEESTPLSHAPCKGCEQGCIMEVHTRYNPDGRPDYSILCDKRDDIGRVPVPGERLRQVRFSMNILARNLMRGLSTDREPLEAVPGRLWFLGKCAFGHNRRVIFLARGVEWPDNATMLWNCHHFKEHPHPLVFTLRSVSVPEDVITVSLGNTLVFEDGKAKLDCALLKDAVSRQQFTHPKAIFSIQYEQYAKRVLVNEKYILARPQVDSENARVMAYLWQNPNRMVTIEELGELSKNLHQILYQLGFRGKIKAAFFTVTKGAVQFHNPATHSRLYSLGLKKPEILKELKKLSRADNS